MLRVAMVMVVLSTGCSPAAELLVWHAGADERARQAAANRRHEQRIAARNQRIRDEAPHCWDPIEEWRDEKLDPQRRQALWDALPADCKEQVRRN